MAEYDASDIIVLKGLEAVRRRPAMYVGNTLDGSGLEEILWGMVGNAIAERLRGGTSSYVRVEIDGETITVEDDGRGISVEPLPGAPEMRHLEAIFSVFHCGHAEAPRVHLGAALPVAMALSRQLDVQVWWDGRAHAQSFGLGETLGPLRDLGPAEGRTGTRIRFTPDSTLLPRHAWDIDRISKRLRELAALRPELTFLLDHQAFRAPDGLADHARYLARGASRLHPAPLRFRGRHGAVEVEVALLWTDRALPCLEGFASYREVGAGTHLEGLRDGLRSALEAAAPARFRGVHAPAFREAVERGLVAVVAVDLDFPYFSTGRDALRSPEAHTAVADVVATGLAEELARQPELLARLLERMPG
jgi:DNA gyrase subunit B